MLLSRFAGDSSLVQGNLSLHNYQVTFCAEVLIEQKQNTTVRKKIFDDRHFIGELARCESG